MPLDDIQLRLGQGVLGSRELNLKRLIIGPGFVHRSFPNVQLSKQLRALLILLPTIKATQHLTGLNRLTFDNPSRDDDPVKRGGKVFRLRRHNHRIDRQIIVHGPERKPETEQKQRSGDQLSTPPSLFHNQRNERA